MTPIPGAKANGNFAKAPIINDPIAAASAVATKTLPAGIPASDNTFGIKNRQYAIVKKVVIAPIISVLKLVPFLSNSK